MTHEHLSEGRAKNTNQQGQQTIPAAANPGWLSMQEGRRGSAFHLITKSELWI
jgi:hypothetical protein